MKFTNWAYSCFFLLLLLTGCDRSSQFLYPWQTKIEDYPLVEKRPTCEVTVSANSVYTDDPLTVNFEIYGATTSAVFDGESVDVKPSSKSLNTAKAGNFHKELKVSGPGGAGTCSVEYKILERVPGCTVESVPSSVLVNDPVKVVFKTTEKITKATLDGSPIAFPYAEKTVATPKAGTFKVNGYVEGPGGTATCWATYVVSERPPTCTIAADPTSTILGNSVKLTLNSNGVVSSSEIDGQAVNFPVGTKVVNPSVAGKYTAHAVVKGPGGEATCDVTYTILEKPPLCQVSATPSTLLVGDSVELKLTGQNKIDTATINGTSVAIPVGSLTLKTLKAGKFDVLGEVQGPGGTASCKTSYTVNERPPTCEISVDPSTVLVGTEIKATLNSSGVVTEAKVDGNAVAFPVGTYQVKTPVAGKFTLKGDVKGPGGTGTCTVSYEVKEPAPVCTLSVSQPVTLQGKAVTVSLKGTGKITDAAIDGKTVTFPNGQLTFTPPTPGKKNSIGRVTGPGGQGTCEIAYGISITTSFTKLVKEISTITDLDILWVIDNSGSMDVYQTAVKNNVKIFMDEYTKIANLKWKMGLLSSTTTENPYVGFDASSLLNYLTPDPVKVFQDAVSKLGTLGGSYERMYDPVKKAVEAHPDFLRPEAGLAILVVTDAAEQSIMSTQEFLDFLKAKKGDLNRVIGYGALGPQDMGCPAGEEDPWNYKGSRYEEFITATKGKTFPICKDFATGLLEIAKHSIQMLSTTPKIKLTGVPVAGTLVLKYKGNVLPEGPKPNGKWVFLAAENSILFHDLDFATGDKEEVEVTYQEVP